MEQNALNKNILNASGIAGLALGLVSTAYMFLTQLSGNAGMSPVLASIIALLLWGAKFGGCIWLMYFFMKRFAAANRAASVKDIFKIGMMTALFSALIFAAASFANMAYISADFFSEQYQILIGQMAPMMDSNSTAMMDKMLDLMPQITFFSNLIYCFTYGTVLSSILSRSISSKDPFADYKPDEQ